MSIAHVNTESDIASPQYFLAFPRTIEEQRSHTELIRSCIELREFGADSVLSLQSPYFQIPAFVKSAQALPEASNGEGRRIDLFAEIDSQNHERSY